jgi:hypothetical protein
LFETLAFRKDILVGRAKTAAVVGSATRDDEKRLRRIEGDEPYDVLLATSAGLRDVGYFGPAVVTAQTACEVIAEEAISIWMELFPDRGGHRESPLGEAPPARGWGAWERPRDA